MNMSDEELLEMDKSQSEIREELSQMSFEALRKLKEKLGSKVYNEALYGAKKIKSANFKRANKNAPQELSSKKKVTRPLEVVKTVRKNIPRDPRFDGLCGTYNEKAFKNAYSFLGELKEQDLKSLKERLRYAQEPEEINKINYLVQRLENQLREEARLKERKEKEAVEKREIADSIREGKKPIYKKKSEKKILNLVSRYEELKNSGKLKKHIRRLRKKNKSKDRKKLNDTDASIRG